MSQNRTSTDFTGTSQPGANAAGNETTNSQREGSSMGSSSGGSSTASGAAGTATALAQEYGTKITEAASQAKEFVNDKMTVVGDKFKELQNADLAEITENAKDYARKNPGQAILISAAAGLLVGLILRGRR
jgi:ElaB/YqjD/DUF883 family membrane-anchored ribosome-binding protein